MNNEVFHDAWTLEVVCSEPVTPQGGDPVRFGFLTGVAVDDENAAGVTVVDFGQRVWDLSTTDRVGGGIAVGDTLFYASATDDIDNVTTGTPFGYALETVGVGLTATIQVLHVPGHGAATLGAGVVGTANIAAGALSADANGRAKMAAGLFDAATVLDKFAADSFNNANLLDVVLNGAFVADAATRALFADGFVNGAKMAASFLNVDLVAGGAAGDHAIAAVAVGDEIVFVGHFSTAAAIATLADLTSEFTAGAGVINNVGGTDTTNDQLMVIWIDKT